MTIHKLLISISGPSGAGKTTFAESARDWLARKRFRTTVLPIAKPLYSLQSKIYAVAGQTLRSNSAQDTELLSFLGAHIRQIDELALLRIFTRDMKSWIRTEKKHGHKRIALICPDARVPDLAWLKVLGFKLGYVSANATIIRQRIKQRGDLNPYHVVKSLEVSRRKSKWDFQLDNSESLSEYNLKIASLLENLTARSP